MPGTAEDPFCESKWYGTEAPEWISLVTAFSYVAIGSWLSWHYRESNLICLVQNILIFTMGLGSFGNHLTSGKSRGFRAADFVPMILMVMVGTCTIFNDVANVLPATDNWRHIFRIVSVSLIIIATMVAVSFEDEYPDLSLVILMVETMSIYAGIGLDYHFCKELSTAHSTSGNISLLRQDSGVREAVFTTRAIQRERERFFPMVHLAVWPALLFSAVWIIVENACHEGIAMYIGWVHGVIWHLGMMYAIWHINQVVLFYSTDIELYRLTVTRKAIFYYCILQPINHNTRKLPVEVRPPAAAAEPALPDPDRQAPADVSVPLSKGGTDAHQQPAALPRNP